MKKLYVSLFCLVALTAFLAQAECYKCDSSPECCTQGDCPCDEVKAAPTNKSVSELSEEEYAAVEELYREMQDAYIKLNIHQQIEKTFQDIMDSNPEAADIAKRSFGVDLENGERVLATPVYYINY